MRLADAFKRQLDAEARRLMAAGLTAEQAWARVASYAAAKQAEAAAQEGIHYGPPDK